ncbi:class I SAM-dependent methyltransferase [uncultured Cytophaga sp.]|uniref:class I SAM-dependent methyltransferase n=1 Tax=uncultured Cytophaga sp. TaxID=160238 RepID=UPI00261A3426|nr:class I SAM-dependent methyltransferase [uncultured Cytophaga sp.]
MKILNPKEFVDYEIIDSGNYKKLERFGAFILSRPEPQAVWDPQLSEKDWKDKAHAEFLRDKANPEKGVWTLKNTMKEQWFVPYKFKGLNLKFRLGLSGFKHVGIFPEQAPNWDYIYEKVSAMKTEKPKVLNLFAYTGGASIAARAAGAEVVHVDSVKQVISWARENMEASELTDIRWVVEDALKFVKREVKRGNKYNGIILDPPAYGRGPDGERWIIEEHLNEILKLCAELLDPKEHFYILNLYAIGFSAVIVETLIHRIYGDVKNLEIGELVVEDSYHKKLPLSIYGRFSNVGN